MQENVHSWKKVDTIAKKLYTYASRPKLMPKTNTCAKIQRLLKQSTLMQEN